MEDKTNDLSSDDKLAEEITLRIFKNLGIGGTKQEIHDEVDWLTTAAMWLTGVDFASAVSGVYEIFGVSSNFFGFIYAGCTGLLIFAFVLNTSEAYDFITFKNSMIKKMCVFLFYLVLILFDIYTTYKGLISNSIEKISESGLTSEQKIIAITLSCLITGGALVFSFKRKDAEVKGGVAYKKVKEEKSKE